jgi:hypothetical protein
MLTYVAAQAMLAMGVIRTEGRERVGRSLGAGGEDPADATGSR